MSNYFGETSQLHGDIFKYTHIIKYDKEQQQLLLKPENELNFLLLIDWNN